MSFNEHAKTWDSPERIHRAIAIAESLRPALLLAPHHHVLEFGCGTGLTSFALNEPVARLVMLDTSEGMLETLKEKIAHHGMTYMTPMLGDLPPETFDVIHTTLVLHHIKEVEQILAKLQNRLRAGGRLAIVDLVEDDGSFHTHHKDHEVHHGFKPEQLREKLETLGFKNVKHEIIYKGQRKHGQQESDYALFMMLGEK